MESLRSSVDYSGGEISLETKTCKRPKIQGDCEDNNVRDNVGLGNYKRGLICTLHKLNISRPQNKIYLR